tara:strand:- start:400 stop:873 length:474 start_codon:yes stop_codon:yes gene_type:complete
MASHKKRLIKDGGRFVNNSQRLFLVYLICILVDMTILNVYAEFTHSIYVESFSITIFIAMFLQLLIVLTKLAEHKLSQFFGDKKGFFLKLKYFFALWALLFFSKVIMLHGANLIFGDKINFYGLFDGLLAFIVLIISFLLGEYLLTKIYRALETKNK